MTYRLWSVGVFVTLVALAITSSAHAMLHPGLGRFLQRDPGGYVDGANLYAARAVLTAVDPSGEGVTYIYVSGTKVEGKGPFQECTLKYFLDVKAENANNQKDAIAALQALGPQLYEAWKGRGEVQWDGKPFTDSRDKLIERIRRETIERLFQSSGTLADTAKKVAEEAGRNNESWDRTAVEFHSVPGAEPRQSQFPDQDVLQRDALTTLKGAGKNVVAGTCYMPDLPGRNRVELSPMRRVNLKHEAGAVCGFNFEPAKAWVAPVDGGGTQTAPADRP